MRTIIVSCDRSPKLLSCDRQTLFNAAMTFAVLGLEVDGVTGQGFLVPFKDRKNNRSVVQSIIGYKGYNTLGARSGLTISGAAVRDGDEFEYEEGSKAFVRHKKKLGEEKDRRIIAAWSVAMANDRPPSVKVLSIDDLLAVKAKSPRGNEPPWNDNGIGWQAMCEKTAKRRLARDLPLTTFQMAARMEEAHEEQQKYAWIGNDGVMVEGDVIVPKHNTTTPTSDYLITPPDLKEEARMAAERGRDSFSAFCRRLTKSQYNVNKEYLESLKPVVEKAENEPT
jgi:recombination protein RecT